MKLDFWFDFNKECSQTIKNLNEAIVSFKNKDELSVSYRSICKNDNSTKFHETYQFLKKKGYGFELLSLLLDLYQKDLTIEDAINELLNHFNFEKDELIHNLNESKSKKVILNHMEHASLQKINEVPTITMSHGIRLKGMQTKDEIKNALINMYEIDSGIEYCEENCER